MAGGRSLPAVLVPLLLAACDAGLFPMKLRQRPPAPPAAMWHPPPSAPPPTLDQRFATDARFRCARMGIRDEDECCAIRFMDKYCCQPCRLVWLNVTAAGLTERGTRYRVEQCLPEADAKVRSSAERWRARARPAAERRHAGLRARVRLACGVLVARVHQRGPLTAASHLPRRARARPRGPDLPAPRRARSWARMRCRTATRSRP